MGQKQAEPSSNLGTSNVTGDGSSRRPKTIDNIKCPNCAGPLSKDTVIAIFTHFFNNYVSFLTIICNIYGCSSCGLEAQFLI